MRRGQLWDVRFGHRSMTDSEITVASFDARGDNVIQLAIDALVAEQEQGRRGTGLDPTKLLLHGVKRSGAVWVP